MGAMEETLPFPRGTTWGDGKTVTDGEVESLLGRVYKTRDTQHSTGEAVYLRCVMNDSASAISATNRCVRFDTTAKDLGRKVAGMVNAQGQISKPIDDAYASGKSIPDHDAFWVVEAGPCNVQGSTLSTVTSRAQYDLLTVESGGRFDDGVAANGDHPLGVLDVAVAATNTAYLVHVQPGLSVLQSA